MKVEVVVPEDYTGDIIGNMSSRRGEIQSMDQNASSGTASIKAIVPLAEMFGYANDIRNMTQGRGSFTMEFEGYNPVPKGIQEEIIKGGGKEG
jgi:elongation factor G